MLRRQFLVAPSLMATSSVFAQSASSLPGTSGSSKPDSSLPSSDRRPLRSVSVPDDGRRVFFFFDYACPFCAVYSETMMSWLSSLPPKLQGLAVPVINPNDPVRNKELAAAAGFYYAATQIGSRLQMMSFSRAVYESYAAHHSLVDRRVWDAGIKAAGFSRSAYVQALQSPAIGERIRFALGKFVDYSLRSTPSVAVGGRYVVTPDDVAGDQAMFYNIINGLASELL